MDGEGSKLTQQNQDSLYRMFFGLCFILHKYLMFFLTGNFHRLFLLQDTKALTMVVLELQQNSPIADKGKITHLTSVCTSKNGLKICLNT